MKTKLERKNIFINSNPEWQKQLELHPDSFYIETCRSIQEDLVRSIQFLHEVMQYPTLLFTHAKDRWGSTYSILYRCIDIHSRERNKGNLHEFQRYLASKMNEVLQAWRTENDIAETLTLEVRRSHSFPSNYVVCVENEPIAVFNFFDQFYGFPSQPQKEEEILRAGQREENRLKEEKKQAEQYLEKLLSVQTKPFANLYSFREFYHILFHRKQMMEKLKKVIEKQQNLIQRINERIQQNRESLPALLQHNEQLQSYIQLIQPFFEQFGYRLETNRSKLY